MKIFSQIPEVLEAQYAQFGDWRARLEAGAPLLKAAADYADKTNISAKFLNREEFPDEPFGCCRIAFRRLDVCYRKETKISDFIAVFAHEIKHMSQADNSGASSCWNYLNFILREAIYADQYGLSDKWCLVHPVDAALFWFINEVDAHTMTGMSGLECHRLLGDKDIKHDIGGQKFIDAQYPIIFNDAALLDESVSLSSVLLKDTCFLLDEVYKKFGKAPDIELMAPTYKHLDDMTGTIWREAGFTSYFATKQSERDVAALRAKLLSTPRYASQLEHPFNREKVRPSPKIRQGACNKAYGLT